MPDTPLALGDLVAVEWRDSFADYGQRQLKDHVDDCRWTTVGWVVRLTDLFVTLASGISIGPADKGDIDSPISIPWTQIVDHKVIYG